MSNPLGNNDFKSALHSGCTPQGFDVMSTSPRSRVANPAVKIHFATPWAHAGADIPGNMPHTSLTDLGNARRLVIAAGNDIRFCHTTKKWLVWDRTRWVKDQTGGIVRLAKNCVRDILIEALLVGDDKQRAALVTHEQRSEAQPRIKAMVSLAESEPGIPIQLEELDRDPLLFNCANGTLDLRTGKLREHRREDLISKIAPVEFDPAAVCPGWIDFLYRVTAGSIELGKFLQRIVGYCLTALTIEQVLFLLYGRGANGKSTFLETLRWIFGDYAAQCDFATFLLAKGQSIRNDVARLNGARFVTAIESDAGKRLAETLVKTVTGGDTVTARFLYAEHFEFQPTFKLFLATNHKPRITGQDDAIWRRIRLIPFTVTIPKAERDGHLPEKLKAEAPGILNWALDGLKAWQVHGLTEPDAVASATGDYRESQDALAHFLEAKCTIRPEAEERASELYRAYKDWTEAAGEFRLTQRDFSSTMSERGFVKKRGNAGFVWYGVEVNSSV
jgi:putative DNA primase/helicase